MKNPTYTKLKKKEVKTSLVQTIEQTLGELKNEKALKKVRKLIKQAAGKISRKFVKVRNKGVKRTEALALTRKNKNYPKKLKGKPGKENIKEAIKI